MEGRPGRQVFHRRDENNNVGRWLPGMFQQVDSKCENGNILSGGMHLIVMKDRLGKGNMTDGLRAAPAAWRA